MLLSRWPLATSIADVPALIENIPLDPVSLVALGRALGSDVPAQVSQPVTPASPKTVADVAEHWLEYVICSYVIMQ